MPQKMRRTHFLDHVLMIQMTAMKKTDYRQHAIFKRNQTQQLSTEEKKNL